MIEKTKVKIISIDQIADNTVKVQYKKPTNYNFEAGQFSQYYLTDGDKIYNRHFTISSAPHEKHLEFATRLSASDFKTKLQKVTVGDEIEISQAIGKFVLHENKKVPAVFITGGIGITPFISMLRQIQHDDWDRQITLIYSNRSQSSAAYLSELQAINNPNFKLILNMTNDKKWEGYNGLIDQAMLEKEISNLTEPIYYTAGPPVMVEAMIKLLQNLNIEKEKIKYEEFFGY